MVHYSLAPCFWQLFLGVWVLHVDYVTLDSSGDDFVRGAMLGLILDTGLATVLGFWKNFTFSSSSWARILALFLLLNGGVYEFDPCDDVGIFSCSVLIFRTAPSGVESPVLRPIYSKGVWTYAFRLKDLVKNNNNNFPGHFGSRLPTHKS